MAVFLLKATNFMYISFQPILFFFTFMAVKHEQSLLCALRGEGAPMEVGHSDRVFIAQRLHSE